MVLDILAGSNAQRTIADIGQAVQCQILIGCEDAAGYADADHAGILFSASLADVTVVLLVSAVEFQNADSGFGEQVSTILQLFSNGAAQEPGIDFSLFSRR